MGPLLFVGAAAAALLVAAATRKPRRKIRTAAKAPRIAAPKRRAAKRTHKLYSGTNHTQKEVYNGASKDPPKRITKSHCNKKTKTIKHWDCDRDRIEWKIDGGRRTQKSASKEAHRRERAGNAPVGYKRHKTGGI